MFLTPNKIADFTDEVAKSRIKIFQLWRKLLAFTFWPIKRITLYIKTLYENINLYIAWTSLKVQSVHSQYNGPYKRKLISIPYVCLDTPFIFGKKSRKNPVTRLRIIPRKSAVLLVDFFLLGVKSVIFSEPSNK